MTDQEINAAVAELCGWIWDFNDAEQAYWMHKERPFLSYPKPPDYCHDLNACHEAEKILNEEQQYLFCEHLVGMATKKEHQFLFRLAHATTRERCEALLRTVGKWRD